MASTSKHHYDSVETDPELQWDPRNFHGIQYEYVERAPHQNASKGFTDYVEDFAHWAWQVAQHGALFCKILSFFVVASICAYFVPHAAQIISFVALGAGILSLIVGAIFAFAMLMRSVFCPKESCCSGDDDTDGLAIVAAFVFSMAGLVCIVAFCIFLGIRAWSWTQGEPVPEFAHPEFWITCGDILFFGAGTLCTAKVAHAKADAH